MILLLGAIGWGLFTAGALSHVTHLDRLESQLASHTSLARPASRLLAAAELGLAIVTPLAFFLQARVILTVIAASGTLLAVGFTVWVLRLFLTGSTLPCACSFSTAPTSRWSVLRAGATALIGCFAATESGIWGEDLATLLTGAAVAVALYLLPDVLAWPGFADEMRTYARRSASQQAPSQP